MSDQEVKTDSPTAAATAATATSEGPPAPADSAPAQVTTPSAVEATDDNAGSAQDSASVTAIEALLARAESLAGESAPNTTSAPTSDSESRVVVLSYKYWKDHYASNPSILRVRLLCKSSSSRFKYSRACSGCPISS